MTSTSQPMPALLQKPLLGAKGLLLAWLTQLEGLLPEKVRHLYIGTRNHTRLYVHNGEAEIIFPDKSSLNTILPAQRLLPLTDEAFRDVSVCLPSSDVFIGHVTLPHLSPKRLKQAMAFEIERRSPYKPEDTLFDYRVVQETSSTEQLIQWAIVSRSALSSAQTATRSLGLNLQSVRFAAEKEGEDFTFYEEKSRRSLSESFPLLALLGTACIFLMTATFGIDANAPDEASIKKEVQHLKPSAEEAIAQNKKVNATLEGLSLIATWKAEPSSSAIFEELTRQLPENAWLSDVSLNDNQLTITGYAPAAAAIVEKLGNSGLFEHPHLTTAITSAEAGPDGKAVEKFSISMTIKGRLSEEAKK